MIFSNATMRRFLACWFVAIPVSCSEDVASGADTQETSAPTELENASSEQQVLEEDRKAHIAKLAAPFDQANYANGKATFARCVMCHSVNNSSNGIGPSLHDIVNRKAATVDGFKYSEAMTGATFSWTPENLDAWISNPASLIPGNSMNYPGMRNSTDRRDLIAYLMTIKLEKTEGRTPRN